jgi:hypothetical protein
MLLVAAAIAGAACLTISRLLHESDAYKAHKEFARAWTYGNLDEALEMTTEGGAARRIVKERKARRFGPGPGATYAVTGIAYALKSETKLDGGAGVSLRVEQPVRVTGDGMESAFGRPVVHDHEARRRRRRASGRWRRSRKRCAEGRRARHRGPERPRRAGPRRGFRGAESLFTSTASAPIP